MRASYIALRYAFLTAIAVVLGLSANGCGDDKPKTLAELVEVLSGNATKQHGEGAWEPAAVGAKFVEGDALRTDAEGEARLAFGKDRLRMGADTTVYFGKRTIDFKGEIEVGEAIADLGLDFGEAEITTTGRVKLTKRGDDLRFEVVVGDATITQRGETTIVEAGQELVFEVGEGSVERFVPVEKKPIDAGVEPATDAAVAPRVSSVTAKVSGKGVRVKGKQDKGWKSLRSGDHELAGPTEIEVRGRAKVTLLRGEDQVTLSGGTDAVVDGEAEQFVDMKRGHASAQANKAAVVIAVPGGAIQLNAGAVAGRADIDLDKKGAQATVRAGTATLRSGDSVEELRVGESGFVRPQGVEVLDRAPKFSHVTLPEGSSSTLHTVSVPANVRVGFKSVCERGVVELGRGKNFRNPAQRRAGDGSAILSLGQGVHHFRVRCYEGGTLSDTVAMSGQVVVRRDPGTRPLPKGAALNTIDADGRVWSVVFQNNLPSLRFRWPKAPKAKSYELVVKPGRGKEKSYAVKGEPAKEFASGAFGEGEYSYWFEGAGTESKKSRLTISFDNAAARGYLSLPKASDKVTGDKVRVKGAAVQGWTVSVAGKELTLDRQYRFDEIVEAGPDGVAVRFEHPKYGAHYYVRSRQ